VAECDTRHTDPLVDLRLLGGDNREYSNN